MNIKETIVVEGRDDTAAIKRSVDALTIETHGFGIRPETWELIAKAYETTGIIVFTDPDHAGDQIRSRILERFPEAAEAFLDCADAEKDGDIGIENASPEAIRAALEKVHRKGCSTCGTGQAVVGDVAGPSPAGAGAEGLPDSAAAAEFTAEDMFRWGLTGRENSGRLRRALGRELGIGQATAKTFLARLNKFGIDRATIEEKLAGLAGK